MAETTAKKTDADAKAPEKPTEPKPDLARAGQSGDPEVQRLLAIRQTHLANGGLVEDPEVETRRTAAREAVADIDAKLEALGYTAG